MVDRTTLPDLPTNTHMTVGQQFTVQGSNFNYWPSEIVLGFGESNVQVLPLPHQNLMKLVSKSDTQLVFEVQVDFLFTTAHVWQYFGSPFGEPRTLLTYEGRS